MGEGPAYNLSWHVVIPLGYFKELVEYRYGFREEGVDIPGMPEYNEVKEPVFDPEMMGAAWENQSRPKGPYLKRRGPEFEGTTETPEGSED